MGVSAFLVLSIRANHQERRTSVSQVPGIGDRAWPRRGQLPTLSRGSLPSCCFRRQRPWRERKKGEWQQTSWVVGSSVWWCLCPVPGVKSNTQMNSFSEGGGGHQDRRAAMAGPDEISTRRSSSEKPTTLPYPTLPYQRRDESSSIPSPPSFITLFTAGGCAAPVYLTPPRGAAGQRKEEEEQVESGRR